MNHWYTLEKLGSAHRAGLVGEADEARLAALSSHRSAERHWTPRALVNRLRALRIRRDSVGSGRRAVEVHELVGKI